MLKLLNGFDHLLYTMSNLRDVRLYCKLNTGKVSNLSTSSLSADKYLVPYSGTQTNVESYLHIHPNLMH